MRLGGTVTEVQLELDLGDLVSPVLFVSSSTKARKGQVECLSRETISLAEQKEAYFALQRAFSINENYRIRDKFIYPRLSST